MSLGSASNTQTQDIDALLSTLDKGGAMQSPVDLAPHLESVRHMPEFQPQQPGLMDELLKHPLIREFTKELNKLMESLVTAISNFLSQIRPPGIATMPDSIQDLFSGFVGFILVLMGLYAFYIMLGWLLRRQEGKKPIAASEPRILERTRLISSDYHSKKAREMSQSGQYDAAVRQLYLALLCLLDEKSLVQFQATRSNREYAENLSQKASHEMGTDFTRLANRFEAAYYGKQIVSADQFTQCEESYRHIEQQAGGGHG